MARVAKPAPAGTCASVCPLLCAHGTRRRLFLYFVTQKYDKRYLFQGIFKMISRLKDLFSMIKDIYFRVYLK